MRDPFESVWKKGIFALVFGLFILATPIQILHDLSSLNDAQHSEVDCPCCHIVSAGLPVHVSPIPTETRTSAQNFTHTFWLADWLIQPPSARDPPASFQ